METRLLLLRHAETAAPDCFHGAESDVGLGPRGHDQARAAASHLARMHPDLLFCSPMLRARETAAPIAEACGLPVQIVADLCERRMGALSGRPRSEGLATYDAEKARWMAGDLDATHPGAESYREVRDRVLPAFLSLADQARGRTVVVVAHGVVIRILLASLLDGYGPADFDRIGIDFVAVNEVVRGEAGWRAVRLNDSRSQIPDFKMNDS